MRLDRVLARAQESLDPQVLLDPFEEQFHLPAVLVQSGDGQRWQGRVVGQEHQGLAGLWVLETDAVQLLGVALGDVEAVHGNGLDSAKIYLAAIFLFLSEPRSCHFRFQSDSFLFDIIFALIENIYNMKSKIERFNIFDFLRLFAATLVLYSHSYPLLGLPSSDFITKIFPFTDGGQLGVLIFFAISGYLNTKSIKRNNSAVFLFNRVIRIFPGLFFALLFSIFIVGPLATNLQVGSYFLNKSTWFYLYQNILLSPNFFLPGVFLDNLYKTAVNGSLWTLPAEFSLYLCLPVVIKLFKLEKSGIIAIAAILLAILLSSYSIDFSRINTIVLGSFVDVVRESFVFFSGAAISYFNVKPDKIKILACAIFIALSSRTGYGEISFIIMLPYLIINIGSLDVKFLRLRNDISYGVYIYAFQIQQLVYHFAHNHVHPDAMAIAAAVFTYIIATISWFFVEKPILNKRNLIVSKFLQRAISDPPDKRME